MADLSHPPVEFALHRLDVDFNNRPSWPTCRIHRWSSPCYVIEPDGNPVGDPITIPLETADLSTTKTEAYICDIVLLLVEQAHKHGCRSIAVENLGFADTRNKGKEWQASSKQFRKTVHGMPTAKFRDRLVSMLHNLDDALWVTAVDPAYTSVLGKSHWLELLQESYNRDCTGHHAAAVVIGRRGMGFTARRRLNIHESEQKSRRECFFRRSIRSCGADETSGAGTGDQMNGTSKPMTHQGSAEPQRLHSAQRPRPMNVTENPGEDKQFDLAARSQTRDKHPCLTELFVCRMTKISACWSRWLRLCWVWVSASVRRRCRICVLCWHRPRHSRRAGEVAPLCWCRVADALCAVSALPARFCCVA